MYGAVARAASKIDCVFIVENGTNARIGGLFYKQKMLYMQQVDKEGPKKMTMLLEGK